MTSDFTSKSFTPFAKGSNQHQAKVAGLRVSGDSTTITQGSYRSQVRVKPLEQPARAPAKANTIEPALLKRALDVIDSLDLEDRIVFDVRLTSLAGIVGDMWASAASSSRYHRQTLAALELVLNRMINEGIVSDGAVRELRAIAIDLSQPTLTQAHVTSMHSQMLDEGISTLAIFEGLESGHDGH